MGLPQNANAARWQRTPPLRNADLSRKMPKPLCQPEGPAESPHFPSGRFNWVSFLKPKAHPDQRALNTPKVWNHPDIMRHLHLCRRNWIVEQRSQPSLSPSLPMIPRDAAYNCSTQAHIQADKQRSAISAHRNADYLSKPLVTRNYENAA